MVDSVVGVLVGAGVGLAVTGWVTVAGWELSSPELHEVNTKADAQARIVLASSEREDMLLNLRHEQWLRSVNGKETR